MFKAISKSSRLAWLSTIISDGIFDEYFLNFISVSPLGDLALIDSTSVIGKLVLVNYSVSVV